jgi:hypothetical protein
VTTIKIEQGRKKHERLSFPTSSIHWKWRRSRVWQYDLVTAGLRCVALRMLEALCLSLHTVGQGRVLLGRCSHMAVNIKELMWHSESIFV